MEQEKPFDKKANIEKDEKPAYVSPQVITYTRDELLEQIGPAMACSALPCVAAP